MENIFVNGRICLFGEHSDWPSSYIKENPNIIQGSSIITGIDQGISANVKKNKKFFIKNNNNKFEIEMNKNKLLKVVKSNNYYSYCCSVAYYMLDKYQVSGLSIEIIKEDLPIKKGLASSAAISILIVKAFNNIYNLNLNMEKIIDVAYESERLTGSNCGKMDQLCAYGKGLLLVNYDDEISTRKLNVNKNLYLVFADLNGKKDTKKILIDLNKSYPIPKNKKERTLHKFLGKRNNEIINEAIKYIEIGNYKKLGKLMSKVQKEFDKKVAPLCSELKAPILHKYLNDKRLKKYTYGSKGVGSQGDGTIQFIAKNEKCQKKLIDIFKKNGLKAYSLTIEKNQKNLINKAIIPVAGNGTRLYPYTKIMTKEFMPVPYKEMLVPQIALLLKEINESKINNICLAVSSKIKKKKYKKFFYNKVKYYNEINKNKIKYDLELQKIYKKLKFINAKKSKGFGYTVSLFKKFANNEPVLLLLGDTLYKSNTSISCTEQLIKAYEKFQISMVGLTEIPLYEACNYGVCFGRKISDNTIELTQIIEKPTIEYAKKNLLIDGKIYGIFGNYIIDNKLFDELERKKKNYKSKLEMQLTDSLEIVRKKYGMYGIILDGISLDFGNVNSYKKNIDKVGD